jgi:hypothetical protein
MVFGAFEKITFEINFYQNGMSLQETNASILQFRQTLKITDLWFDESTLHKTIN